jgi:hypothetical protein
MFFLTSCPLFAQTKEEWQPIFLQLTGANTMNGVEASFLVTMCNGEDVVFVKFVNDNTYPVKLEWFDAVFTQELKWINKDGVSDKKSITLAANAEVKGTCSSSGNADLVVKMKNFITDKKDLKRYSTSKLLVIAAQ